MTSTLQQEASRKLRFSAQQTMRVAQRLYENGYITYMRTDSTTLSESAIAAARDQARELYGADAVPAAPRQYNRQREERAGGARGDPPRRRPLPHARRGARASSSGDEFALYELIWKRTVASQMADARGETVSVRIGATAADGRDAEFATAGTVITFRGFLLAYEEGRDEPAPTTTRRSACRRSPKATRVEARELEPDGHSTLAAGALHGGDARARRSRSAASAARRPTRRSWGRSSTAATCARQGQALVPSFLAFAVVEPARAALRAARRLRVHGPDGGRPRPRSPAGEEARTRVAPALLLREDGDPGLKALVEQHLGDIDARAINTIAIGSGIDLRVGRYGPYSSATASAQTSPTTSPRTS